MVHDACAAGDPAMMAALRRRVSLAQRADRCMRTACRRCAKGRDAPRSASIDERLGTALV
ncbi:hypothetical protein C6P86_06650 [Burkholderia multivorans]|nr:hypothetical protein C6P86_06650 [Burkholderia multivorans]PRE77197.1 hypothetical protein C6Q00_28335 [Burkholderia multivorans]PRG17416.1 hypothetical protein C6T57_27030 [Burkholderia multivorans]PRG25317.1 hypothetical protein C6Q35_08435 [Burkholderia multivorans]